eukprot:scaffold3862_cov201-Alexandrium_tamarense.AAC.6
MNFAACLCCAFHTKTSTAMFWCIYLILVTRIEAFTYILPPPVSPSSTVSTSQLSLTSSTPSLFSPPKAKRRIIPSTTELILLEPIGNGTFGGVFWAKNEATGE